MGIGYWDWLTFATGYGPMSAGDLGHAIAPVLRKPILESMSLAAADRRSSQHNKQVVRRSEEAMQQIQKAEP